jgi:hypothetical protein
MTSFGKTNADVVANCNFNFCEERMWAGENKPLGRHKKASNGYFLTCG